MSKIRSLFYRDNNSKKNKKKTTKIILNKPEDLLRISKEDFDKINISNLCGDYYEQIYKEALEIEKKNAKLKNNNKKSKEKNNDIKNSKSKILNNKKNQTNNLKSILRKNQRERMLNKKPSKSRSKSKEKNIIIKNHNYKILANQFNVNIINNVKDKKHLLSPEIPSSKINNFEFEKIKDNNINKNNKNQFNLNLFQNKKIEVNLLPAFDKIKKNNQKNNIISKKGENTNNNNKIKINYTKYKSDEIKINKKNSNNHYEINKMVFYVRYDSNYGDNIGILGSIDQLGNWSQDKILYLKWNNGNIWKGEIDLDNSNISRFEFKFINRYDGIIYWEKGFNNIIDLNALEEEVRCQKKGRFNKFEYSYDINNSEITLTCKIKEWE